MAIDWRNNLRKFREQSKIVNIQEVVNIQNIDYIKLMQLYHFLIYTK